MGWRPENWKMFLGPRQFLSSVSDAINHVDKFLAVSRSGWDLFCLKLCKAAVLPTASASSYNNQGAAEFAVQWISANFRKILQNFSQHKDPLETQ